MSILSCDHNHGRVGSTAYRDWYASSTLDLPKKNYLHQATKLSHKQ